MGVSPVYVETEVEYLEQYGFLRVQKGRYIAGFIINEPTAELLTMQNTMYAHAAELVANDLYEELMVLTEHNRENIYYDVYLTFVNKHIADIEHLEEARRGI